MFSNAKNVEINGKTVKSIILENGAILYKKEDPYLLSITSDKDILSYYDNDIATLTATLTENNSPLPNEQVLFYDSDRVSLATYYDWLDVFLFTVTSENQGEIIFDTTNAEHNNFYTEDTTSGGGYSNGGRVKFVITDTQVETWRYNSSTDTWTKSFMLYNLPVKIGFSYGTEVISDTAKIPFFASATTDNNGEATATYNSMGIGDVSITAECMNLQETYELEDLYDYDLTTYNNNATTSSLKLPNGNFELTYKSILKTSTAHSTCLNIYGVLNDDTTQVSSAIGLMNRPSKMGFHTSFVVNEVWEEYWHSSPVTVNSEYLVKYIYNNGQHSLYVDGDLLITTSKIMKNMHDILVVVNYNEWIKYLKIKYL